MLISFQYWRYFYWITAFSAFCVTVGLHLWEEFLKEKYRPQRVVIFAVWAVFGFVPTFHWFFLYGGWSHPWVKVSIAALFPNITGYLYIDSHKAFERLRSTQVSIVKWAIIRVLV